MKPCRECEHLVSEDAATCPNCGAPRPARAEWNGYGYEYKSPIAIGNLPLLHVSFKYKDRRPVPAIGVIAIGQFAFGVVTLGQFSIGWISVSQFTIAAFALAQFAIAWDCVAQMCLYLHSAHAQRSFDISGLLAPLIGG
ncbi:MAG: zinc ribbon domain-containing protein [Planctomycetota bacterium]